MRLFAYAFLAAALQVFLSYFLAVAITHRQKAVAIIIAIFKFLIYGVCIHDAIIDFIWFIDYIIYGFIAGAAAGVVLLLVYKMIPKSVYVELYKTTRKFMLKTAAKVKELIKELKEKRENSKKS